MLARRDIRLVRQTHKEKKEVVMQRKNTGRDPENKTKQITVSGVTRKQEENQEKETYCRSKRGHPDSHIYWSLCLYM